MLSAECDSLLLQEKPKPQTPNAEPSASSAPGSTECVVFGLPRRLASEEAKRSLLIVPESCRGWTSESEREMRYRGFSKSRTRTALGSYARASSRGIGPPYGRCVFLISSSWLFPINSWFVSLDLPGSQTGADLFLPGKCLNFYMECIHP